jgi:hypothetical protein
VWSIWCGHGKEQIESENVENEDPAIELAKIDSTLARKQWRDFFGRISRRRSDGTKTFRQLIRKVLDFERQTIRNKIQ